MELELQFVRQLEHCRQLASRFPQDEVVLKALKFAEKSLRNLKSSQSSNGVAGVKVVNSEELRPAIQSYTQSVLDSSYHQECRLVESEFPSDCAEQSVIEIIGSLCKPASLCPAGDTVCSTLGVDHWECLHWRAGALLYMYTHNLMGCPEKRQAVRRKHFQECCCVGVSHLRLMLTARTPLKKDEEVAARDPSLPLLLHQGIFSDVHMLALMYAGELCFWAWEQGGKLEKEEEEVEVEEERREGSWKAKNEQNEPNVKGKTAAAGSEGKVKYKSPEVEKTGNKVEEAEAAAEIPSGASSTTPQEKDTPGGGGSRLFSLLVQLMGAGCAQQQWRGFAPVSLGLELLGRYIEAARGPLRQQNWSYTRAVQLSVQLRKAASSR